MNCPKDLNSFLLGEPLFENTFPDNECEQKKFYGDCFHCFATSICKRDKQLINGVLDKITAEINELDEKYIIGDYAVYGENSPKYVRLWKVLQIINKYKKGDSE